MHFRRHKICPERRWSFDFHRPTTLQINWWMPLTLIVDNNMAVILLTRDDALRKRIRAAIKESHHD